MREEVSQWGWGSMVEVDMRPDWLPPPPPPRGCRRTVDADQRGALDQEQLRPGRGGLGGGATPQLVPLVAHRAQGWAQPTGNKGR